MTLAELLETPQVEALNDFLMFEFGMTLLDYLPNLDNNLNKAIEDAGDGDLND